MDKIFRDSITGVANVETAGTGIQSTQAEKRHVKKIFIYVTGHIGNIVRVYLDTDKVIELADYFFITGESTGSANVQRNTNRVSELDVNFLLELGQVLKVALLCGGTAKNLEAGYGFDVGA